MPAVRVNVPLSGTEAQVLIQMAKDDCRHPREQLRYLLRNEAERRGFVLDATEMDAPASHFSRQEAGAQSNS